ncbi:sugar transporter [Colletotrichum truncatum]|uniref:Sugar transporter n=1 Tax=Colletotrichum truncatum TaxID=5467 RepID=A0ACC3YCY4_COLTU|nr:sugar transporter [Colletotrichum truncatum]KAF6783528.1 sugar transporter [Colletotrichum truncatum]
MPLIDQKVYEQTPKEVISWKIIGYCAILSFTGALHGFNTANISGVLAMKPFKSHFLFNDMDTAELANWNGWITSVLILGSCLGSLTCAPFIERLGRRLSLVIFTILFVASAVLMTANPGGSGGRIEFIVGRALSGYGSGAASVVGPGYIAEIAPQSIRGGLTALYNANTMLSVGLAYWINFGSLQHISSTKNAQWQVPMGVQALPGVILLLGLLFMPESPRWPMNHGKIEKAQSVLENLRSLPRDHPFVRQEFEQIQRGLEDQPVAPGLKGLIREILSENIRKRLYMVMFIQVGFQFSGGNIITYYNTSILSSIGLTDPSVNYLFSGIYGLVKFIAVLLYCLFLIDRFGRRMGLFIGSGLIIGSLTYITVYLAVANPSGNNGTGNNGTGPAGWVAVVCIYIFALGYAISWGTIPWIINAEVFPTKVRGSCMAICITWQYLVNFALSRAQPNMVITMHSWGPFLLFTLFTTISTTYCYFAYPETKGISMESMDQLFQMPWYKVGKSSLAIVKSQNLDNSTSDEEKVMVVTTENADGHNTTATGFERK